MAEIIIKNLTAYYKQRKDYLVALDDVSLQVPSGTLTVLVGPSGCGKTTLLDSLEYTQGEIIFDGVPAEKLPVGERGIAYVSQEYGLYPSMTVYDNLAYPLRQMHTPYKEIDVRVKAMAEQLGLTLLLSRKPKQLSGGQQQRAAIGRALIKRPKIILFDEPFTQLDPQLRRRMQALVQEVHRTQRPTIIFSTHDLEEAKFLAEWVVIMDAGKIEREGTAEELIDVSVDRFTNESRDIPQVNASWPSPDLEGRGKRADFPQRIKNHLRYNWGVWVLACFAVLALCGTIFRAASRPDGQDVLNVILVSDRISGSGMETDLRERFGDSFREVLVEQYSPADPQLSQRLAVAVVDERDLVILPALALLPDTGDAYFCPIEADAAERYFPERNLYVENGTAYGVALAGAADELSYLFFIGTSQNLAELTGNQNGDNRAVEPAQWLVGGGGGI